jgi:hypothetical protein
LVAGYTVNDRFALQLNTPLIYREFKRPEGFAIDAAPWKLGDMSILLSSCVSLSSGRRTFEFGR